MSSNKAAPEPGRAARTSLQRSEVAWLAMAVFVVSSGYGALLPVMPGWLLSIVPSASSAEVARHVGQLGAVYALGLLLGAPMWGFLSDRAGRNVILMTGLLGYVASLVALLLPQTPGLWELYALRGSAGFFVAAIVPLVSVIVAEGSTEAQRARRFAWMSSMSLLGFLVGPATIAAAAGTASWFGAGVLAPSPMADSILLLTAVLAGVTLIGLWFVVRLHAVATVVPQVDRASATSFPLWVLSAGVMFVLASFELGILLVGQRNAGVTSVEAALMFAECSLVMLGVNAFLFFTSVLKTDAAHRLIGTGLTLAMAGLLVLSFLPAHGWMYLGVSLTAAGTGLVLPVVAYLAAGASPAQLGMAMGGLAAAAGLGQTLGSASGGWLFGASAQHGFGWLALPLAVMWLLMVSRRRRQKNRQSVHGGRAPGMHP